MNDMTLFAKLFQIYMNSPSVIQGVIQNISVIITDPNASPEEIDMACNTLHEALFPTPAIDLETMKQVDIL